MSLRTVAVVQARMGSSRFPGKMLASLGHKPVLEWVLRRASRATRLDDVVLATTNQQADDKLVELANQLGLQTFRGDEDDVLNRFVCASEMASADRVVRVCADNPFVDPGEIDRLIDFFSIAPCDYACNNIDRLGSRYADGFGAEILPTTLLRRIDSVANEPRLREHVTLFLWEHAGDYHLRSVPAPRELAYPELAFDVDVPDDLFYLERLIQAGVELTTPAAAIVELALRDAHQVDR